MTLSQSRLWWATVIMLPVAAFLALGGCTTMGYYTQSIGGHLDLMSRRRDIDAVVEDASTSEALKEKLERASAMREFAVRELALPDGGSYRSYVDIGRRYVVWNVVAAPELSLTPRTWCFPVAGCVSYRGYFDEADARAYADELAREGFDVHVAGARAYSTLGWFDDPLLNTVVDDPEYRLAGTMFHELAHQRLYVPGDTTFNESYAVTVERVGVKRWLERHSTREVREAYERDRARRDDFLTLVTSARESLERVYASSLSDDDKRREKHRVMERLRDDYRGLKDSWGGYEGYDAWFTNELNNAKLVLVATYSDYVAAFERLLQEHAGDMRAFHEACEALSNFSEKERNAELRRLAGSAS